MSKHDWYRRTEWSEVIRKEFFERLKRSRGNHNKAQYLRIQANYLQNSGTPENLRAALELLDLLCFDYPVSTELAQAHFQRADCLKGLGQTDEAIAAYRESFKAQRAFPNVHTQAPIRFGLHVVHNHLTPLYREAIQALDELWSPSGFPIDTFHEHAIRGIVANAQDDFAKASLHARKALEAAYATQSGFRFHRFLGLVPKKVRGDPLFEEIRRIGKVSKPQER